MHFNKTKLEVVQCLYIHFNQLCLYCHINVLFEINTCISAVVCLYKEQQGNNHLSLFSLQWVFFKVFLCYIFVDVVLWKQIRLCLCNTTRHCMSGVTNRSLKEHFIRSCATINAMLRFNVWWLMYRWCWLLSNDEVWTLMRNLKKIVLPVRRLDKAFRVIVSFLYPKATVIEAVSITEC